VTFIHHMARAEIDAFSVVSYNILAQVYSKSLSLPYVERRFLRHKYRHPLLKQEIKRLDGDVLCFQECDEYDQIKKHMNGVGYEGLFKCRTGTKKDGCAIFWKRDKFALEASHTLELNKIAQAQDDDVYKRDNVAIFATLIMNSSAEMKKRICISTTHIYWDPVWPEVKFRQIRLVVEEMIRLRTAECPLIICGDLNSMPNSVVYKYLSGTEIKESDPELAYGPYDWDGKGVTSDEYTDLSKKKALDGALRHNLNLKSAYSNYKGTGHEPTFTNFQEKFQGTLDYIFYETEKLDCTHTEDLPTRDDFKEDKGIPGERHSSDHVPLKAVFCWK